MGWRLAGTSYGGAAGPPGPAGPIGGGGVAGKLARWTGGAAIGSSLVTDNGTSVEAPNLGLGPQQNDFADGVDMAQGQVDDFAFVDLPDFSVMIVKGADNGGTRLGGIDATGIPDGRLLLLINSPQGVTEPTDAGCIVLEHEAATSAATNRFSLPRHLDQKIACRGSCWLRYCDVLQGQTGGGSGMRWQMVNGPGGNFARITAQALSLYPNLEVGSIAGQQDNWDPVGNTSYGAGVGLDGGNLNFAQYAAIRVITDAGGASITGMKPNHASPVQGTNADPDTLGDIKILINEGPGDLVITHLDGASDAGAQFLCPGAANITIKPFGCVGFARLFGDPNPTSQWFTLFVASNPADLPSVTADALTTPLIREYPSTSPAALAAAPAVVHDLDRGGSGLTVRLTGNAAGSYLGGLKSQLNPAAGASRGEVARLINDGNYPIVLLDSDAGSTAGYRFELPGAKPFVLQSRAAVTLVKDDTDNWKLDATEQAIPPSTFIVDAVMPAGNFDDWHPIGTFGGLIGYDFSYCGWIKALGGAASVVRSMDPPVGGDGTRIFVTNYNNAFTIKHASGTGATGKDFWCPGAVNFAVAALASFWLTYDAGNAKWVVSP